MVRLIDEGDLRALVPGSVRRNLLLEDVLAYRENLRARRNRFITESSARFDAVDSDEPAAMLGAARRQR